MAAVLALREALVLYGYSIPDTSRKVKSSASFSIISYKRADCP